MDAWDTLISNSSIDSGDAWEHLNNIDGGGEIINNIMLLEEFKYNLVEETLEVFININGD